MSLQHKIKRVCQRVSINSRKKINQSQSALRSNYEKEAISICRSIILKNNTDLLISPLSGKRYANNETLGIHIFIREDSIDIINHSYQYNIPICNKSHQTILNIFDGHVEMKREKMEDDIRSNVKHSLENILNIVRS
jgi:hypothetical protein